MNGPTSNVPGESSWKSNASDIPGSGSRSYARAIRAATPCGPYTGIRGFRPSGAYLRATQ